MQFQLKPLSQEAIPVALERAHRYRLLNEPWQAESICQDVLQIDPNNQSALVTLLLAITDQFDAQLATSRALAIVSRIEGVYEREYYSGIVYERLARARMRHRSPGANFSAYDDFQRAMQAYERAEQLRPPGNDEALFRWNTCVRTLMQHADLRPEPEERLTTVLDD